MSVNAKFEYTPEGRKKTRMIANIPAASGKQLASWGAKTVRRAKLMVGGHGIIKSQSGHLRRNIGMDTKKMGANYRLTVGTGVGSLCKTVKYADVLDRGATIRAKKKMTFKRKGKTYRFKNGPYLYVPIYGGGMRHVGEPKSFRLVKSVRIPPFGWFSRKTIKHMLPELNHMMGKRETLKTAKGM